MKYTRDRLFCLDALRGLDMILLTVIVPFVDALDRTVALPPAVTNQFLHFWGGFMLIDLVMPLFIFMCGAAVPFALGRRMKDGRPTGAYWRHVAWRVVLLWVLGMIVQGHLLSLDPLEISPFNNTLQTIACGYLIAALVFPIRRRWVRWSLPVVLAVGYALALHFGGGHYTRLDNIGSWVEKRVVEFLMPTGTLAYAHADPGYTWWFTIPMYGAMTLCGMVATEILTAQEAAKTRFLKLLGLGGGLLAVGWAFVPWIPMIKHLFTFTFTAQAMGWSCLALALLFGLTDLLRVRRGFGLVTLFGQTALLAYMMIECFASVPDAFAATMTQGFAAHVSEQAVPLARWFFSTLFLIVTLWYYRQSRCSGASRGFWTRSTRV